MPTSEQRDQHPLCGAKARTTGEPCRKYAGEGTDHLGFGRCRYHGGSTSAHRKNALKLEAQQRMVASGVQVEDAEPHMVLLQELAMSAGHVGFLREEIAALEPEEIGSARSVVLLGRYDQERDRLTRIAKACSEAGVDEVRIRIEEVKAAQLVTALTAAAKDAGIPPDYVRALGPALRKQFALAAGDPEAAEAADSRVAAVREEIAAAEAERAEKAGQRYAGLVPAEELVAE